MIQKTSEFLALSWIQISKEKQKKLSTELKTLLDDEIIQIDESNWEDKVKKIQETVNKIENTISANIEISDKWKKQLFDFLKTTEPLLPQQLEENSEVNNYINGKITEMILIEIYGNMNGWVTHGSIIYEQKVRNNEKLQEIAEKMISNN